MPGSYLLSLALWAASSAAYLNDTLVGALEIAFAILIPHGMPMEGPDVPHGWSYNPSTWLQRPPAMVGFLGARYTATYRIEIKLNALKRGFYAFTDTSSVALCRCGGVARDEGVHTERTWGIPESQPAALSGSTDSSGFDESSPGTSS